MQALLPVEPVVEMLEPRAGGHAAVGQGEVADSSGRASGGRPSISASSGGDAVAQVAAVDDQVDRAVLEQELAALEAFGQRLAHGLLDDARAGEADQRARLGDVEVAEHRQARGHAARGRVGQHGDERQARLRHPRQHRTRLAHLQQREQAFLHARAAAR